ncbi:MAG: Ldh family oxidoreductase, partial [Pseudomonadota bacterium]
VAALAGTMAPVGGAKGAALALMVEVMSACLAGAALGAEATSLFDNAGGPPNLGQVLLAVDPDAVSDNAFDDRIADLAAIYDDLEGARFPGARRFAAREKAAEEGLWIKARLLEQIREIAGGA